MKKKAQFGLVFTVIAFSSMFLSTTGFAYDIADYFPLDQGFTWTHELTSNGSTYEEVNTIDGTEDVGGVTTTKMVDDDGSYTCFAIDSQGLRLYKGSGQKYYMIFDPPQLFFPAEVIVGKRFTQVSNYTWYMNDTADSSGTVEINGMLETVEDVSVPAGNFSGCLKIQYTVKQYDGGIPGYTETDTTIWLAPDVGIVKREGTETEYDDTGQSSGAPDYSEQVLLSYDAPDNDGSGGGGGGGGGGGCFIHSILGWPDH